MKTAMSTFRNQYIPKFATPEERNFFTYLNELKYEETVKNLDKYFSNVKVIDFDMSRGDPLEKTEN